MIASILAAAAATYLAIALAVIGSRRPSYSQARHTISELGEYGSPDQQMVAFGVFLPIGLALLLAAFVLQPRSAPSAGLALCIGIGYIVAAAFPCDPGSPSSGSTRQALHNIGGGIEYFGGAYALLRLSESFGAPFRAAGFFVAAAAIIISVPAVGRIRGIVQRFAEACLFAALVWCTWVFGVGA
jgi:hypothetical protein